MLNLILALVLLPAISMPLSAQNPPQTPPAEAEVSNLPAPLTVERRDHMNRLLHRERRPSAGR